jgi:hypothetical protein
MKSLNKNQKSNCRIIKIQRKETLKNESEKQRERGIKVDKEN